MMVQQAHPALTNFGADGNHELAHSMAVIHMQRLDRPIHGTHSEYALLLLVLQQILPSKHVNRFSNANLRFPIDWL